MSDRSGVEIDFCPQCRGVWLDRGELDKIIDRAATPPQRAPDTTTAVATTATTAVTMTAAMASSQYGKRKKENWLSELLRSRFRLISASRRRSR